MEKSFMEKSFMEKSFMDGGIINRRNGDGGDEDQGPFAHGNCHEPNT